MVENYILRRNARSQLGGRILANKWILCAAMFFISNLISNVMTVPSSILDFLGTAASSPILTLTGAVASIVSFVLAAPFGLGLANGCLKIVENDDSFSVGDVFSGFRRFSQAFMLQLMQSIYVFLWSLLFIIPGIVKSYSYAMSVYILRDNEDYEWRDAIDESRDMMHGHKLQLFLLDLSFIGWYLLGALCFGIGVIFVTPYHQVARANFYEALVAHRCNSAQVMYSSDDI